MTSPPEKTETCAVSGCGEPATVLSRGDFKEQRYPGWRVPAASWSKWCCERHVDAWAPKFMCRTDG